jgi:hypothetical protein
LENIPLNSNPTENQISHSASVIRELNNDVSKEISYYHLTDTLVDTSAIVTNNPDVNTFQNKTEINNIFKKNRYFTPKKMFKDSYFFENNYHSIGKTLTAHIETLISNTSEDIIRKILPWEYTYYKIYNYRGRQQGIGTNLIWNDNSNNNNPLRYLGYQIFDNLIDVSLGYSESRFPSSSSIITDKKTIKDTVIPKNLLYGTEMIPQNPTNVTGISTINQCEIYPVHSIFLDEGIYNIVQLMDVISNKMNSIDTVHFDWTIRDWRKSFTPSNKYILQSNQDKRIFELRYDFTNSIIRIYQYKLITYGSSIADKIIDEKRNTGKTGVHIIVNEGYPHICIMNEGHLFKNGSFVKIGNSDNILNINQDYINRLHNAMVNPVFRIHLRSIFPIPMDVYFRKTNSNVSSGSALKLDIHQTDTGNTSSRYDANTPDSNYKVLLEIYGNDILNLLNKGTIENMLNYVGSKLSQNYQDQNKTYPPFSSEEFTKFQNHITETTQETIHNPENPFISNELFMLYRQALGESDKLTIGRVIRKDDYADSNGNFILDFELLTGRSNSFTVGDIIVGMESNAISMIVPYYWEESRFPSKNELNAGMREYLITTPNFNTHVPNFYWNTDGSKTKDDNQLEKKWYLQEVYNGEVSFSVDVDTIPNASDIVGISNDILEILKPTKFSLLSGLENNITSKLGFKHSREGIINPTISSTKIIPHFKTAHSNTVKSNEITIKSSKFVKMYDNKFSNYLMIESYDNIPYEKGDRVYFENHVLNKFTERNFKADELLIKRIYPLKDWFYSIESRYIHHILSYGKLSLEADPFTLVSGSTEITVTHKEHGLNAGDKITIEGATTVLASSVTAANLNITTIIKRIVDKDSYIIEPTIDATPNTNASLGNNPFSITNGSDIITVTHSSHNLSTGTKIVISGAASVLPKYVISSNLNVTTEIVSVTDSNTYTITPTIAQTPDSTTTGGGASVVISPYVYGGGSSVKITIDYPTTTLGTNPISITNGSNIVSVTHTAHGLLVGDIISISGATTVLADKVLAADLNVTTVVTSVTDSNTYTITPLLTATPNSTTTGGGSAITITHNAAAGVMHRKIKDMKRWFYQNVNKWTDYNIDYKNYIIKNYLYPRVLHGETQTIIHISKILLKETTGDGISSTAFIPGMTLTHNGGLIGLKVIGITKRYHKTDILYNEEPVKNIDEISNGDYYYVYFQRLSTLSLNGLDAGETITYTDSSGSTNLRSASGTLTTIEGERVSYINDASVDYLYYFYLANKTILEYRTPITKEEENYIESNNINISENVLKINPFSGSNDYPYVANLSYDPNNSNIDYGQTGAVNGPFTVTNGSNVIKVTHPYHGLCEGDEITITGATTIIASRVTAYNLNVTTKITKIIDETYYNIEPTLDATPNASTTGGGVLVKLEYCPSSVDINVNAIPISVLNPGDNIYITNHQKLIPKYYEEGDVIESSELYLNRFKGDYYDQNTDAVVDNNLVNHVSGIKNGNYKILSNLWAGMKSDNYFMNRYWPGKTVLTDIEWTDKVSKGFLNQGGKIRTKTRPYHIIGNNEYDKLIKNKLKVDSVNDDLTGEIYSVLSNAVTTSTTESVTTIIVKHGVNFRVGGYIIIDPIIYSQHTESTKLHTEQNNITESNMITAITEITPGHSLYSIFPGSFELTLQFRLLNNHLINSYVVQKGYVSTLLGSPTPSYGSNQIGVNDPDYFVVGDIINIGFNSYDTTKTDGDDGYYRELKNIVTAKSGSILTLQNTLLHTYATGTYIIKMAPSIIENNISRHNFLATQNVLIRGEWYTKIFYQGPNMMEDINVKDGEYSEGANAFNKYSQKEVYISGMKGLSIPQLSFDNHSSYITDRANFNSITTKTSYNIEQITPVPDGFYTTFPNIEQDGREYLMTDFYNIPIKGGFYIENNTPYEKNMYWRDTGYSRDTTITTGTNKLNIGTLGVFGKNINVDERNETQLLIQPTDLEIDGGGGPDTNNFFGRSIKISGNYLAVSIDRLVNGKVFVYYKNQATGVYEIQTLIDIKNNREGESQEQDELYNITSRFGTFMDITDKYLAISAAHYPNVGNYGRVYIYKREGTNWKFLRKWDAVNDLNQTHPNSFFGRRTALTNEYMVVGCTEPGNGYGSGKVFLFGKNVGGTDNWGHIKTILYPGTNEGDAVTFNELFGFSCAIDGDYISVGAQRAPAYDTESRSEAGLAFVFYKNQGGRDNWGLQQTLYAQLTNGTKDIQEGGKFGQVTSIRGRYLLVSAHSADDSGVGYVFYRTGSVWSIQQKIVPNIPISGSEFGIGSLSPNAIYAVISARVANKAYVFKRNGNVWEEHCILVNSSPITGDFFGDEIEYDGEYVLLGAPGGNIFNYSSSNEASQGYVCIYKQENITEDGKGILSIHDHTRHKLYVNGSAKILNVDYSFKNDTQIQNIENLTNNPIAVTEDSDVVTITHLNHGFSVNDNITIMDSESINDLASSYINVSKTITSVVDINSYTVDLGMPQITTSSLLLNYEAWNYSGSGNWLNQVNTSLNPGVLDSNVTYNSSGVKSFDFIKTHDHRIDCGAVDLAQNWSLEVWVKLHNLIAGNDAFLGHGTRTASKGLQAAIRGSGSRIRYTFFGTNNTIDFSTNPTVSNNEWVHFVLTYNDSTYERQVYQNGTLLSVVSSGNAVEYTNNSGNFSIGAGYSSGITSSEMNGEVAVVRMYTKVLSSSEVTSNYNYGYNDIVLPSSNGSGGGSSVKISRDYPLNSIVEQSIDGWRKMYETGRQFNCILIKGKYLGYGGQIEFRDKENIMEHPDGYRVKQVIYTDNNKDLPSYKFLIDLEKRHTDVISTLENDRTIPSSSLYKNLNLIETNNLFADINVVGTGGKVYKLVQDEPVNVEQNFINMCVKDLGTMTNTESNTIDNIFAKILLPSGSGAIHYDTFTSTGKEFYDKPMRELTEFDIRFVNDKNQLVDFNGYDHSFTIEIIELDEELLKINPTSGMIV